MEPTPITEMLSSIHINSSYGYRQTGMV